MVCLELQREGDVTILHIRLTGKRLPQGQNRTFWGRGHTTEQDVLMQSV